MVDLLRARQDTGLASMPQELEAQLLSVAFALSPIGMAFIEPSLCLRAASEEWGRQVGQPLSELIGQPLPRIFPGWDERVAGVFLRVRDTGRSASAEALPFRAHQPERGATYWDVTVSPVVEADNVFRGWLLTQSEVTRHEEVRRRATELDAIIAAISDGLIIFGPDGEIVRMNHAAETILGISRAEGQRMAPGELVAALHVAGADGQQLPPDDPPHARALRGETVVGCRLAVHRRDGAWADLLTTSSPVRDEQGQITGAVSSFVDITPILDLQRQRDDILRAVSHDLRNPLTVVLGQAQVLTRRLDKESLGRQLQSIRAIESSAQRMNAMIQDLVDSARAESGQLALDLAPVDLYAYLPDLVQRLTGTMPVERIRIALPAGLPPVCADADRLDRILTNLLSNACKYSTPGTPVEVTAEQRDDEVITAVRDRGPGIPPEQLPQLFQRYVRAPAAREQREGLGLGLFITRLLVEAHAGRIWAESEPSVGSTFSFSLPIARECP
jgi:PAS domain S-box-containing protein